MNTTKDDNNLKEPVKLRYKALKDGNQSIYLDYYVNGIREYKLLSLYLRPETGRENKLWNREQLRLANAIKAQYIIDIQNGECGFKDRNRSRKLKKAGISKHVTFHCFRHGKSPFSLKASYLHNLDSRQVTI